MRRLSGDEGLRRLINLVIDPDAPFVAIDEYLWAQHLEPHKVCTCPDGSGAARGLHAIRAALHMTPAPVSKWDCDPRCPFCGLKGVAFEPYRTYSYPYSHVADVGLTILLVPPPPSEARRITYGDDLKLAGWAVYDLQPTDAQAVLDAIDGSCPPLPLAELERILIDLRRSHQLIHEHILRQRGSKDTRPADQLALAYQDAAMHFVVPFWTNICYFPHNNAPDRCECIRPVFSKMIDKGRLVLPGNFAVAAPHYDFWWEHLEPLGAVST